MLWGAKTVMDGGSVSPGVVTGPNQSWLVTVDQHRAQSSVGTGCGRSDGFHQCGSTVVMGKLSKAAWEMSLSTMLAASCAPNYVNSLDRPWEMRCGVDGVEKPTWSCPTAVEKSPTGPGCG